MTSCRVTAQDTGLLQPWCQSQGLREMPWYKNTLWNSLVFAEQAGMRRGETGQGWGAHSSVECQEQREGEEEDAFGVDDVICSKYDPGAVACASVTGGSSCFRFCFPYSTFKSSIGALDAFRLQPHQCAQLG